jgi:hypothetical protein
MDPEGSLPHSQEPATFPYSEPDQSMPPIPLPEDPFLMFSAHLRLGRPSGLFLSGFPTKTLSSPYTCYVPRPSHYC